MELFLISIIFLLLLFIIYRLYFYKTLYNNFTDGISIISDNKIIDCNEILIKLFAYDNKKELLSVHPLNLTPAFQPDNSLSCDKAQEMMNTAEKIGKCKFDWVFLDKNENEKWIEIDIVKLPKTFLTKQKFCMIWRDIKLRVTVQSKLQELNTNLEKIVCEEIAKNKEKEKHLIMQSKLAQLGEMMSMIAHQWRQPLTAISSSVIDLQMKLVFNKNEKNFINYVEKHLNDVENFTESLTQTIDDFRNFYKPEKLTKESSLTLIVQKAYSMINNYFVANNIKIIFEFNSVKKIYVLENELIQVCLNIIENSRENFLNKEIENPQIKIITKDVETGVLLTICDNGGGCKEETLNKIFEPYFSTKYEKNGTGLGLYISLKIVQEHHEGNIDVLNTQDGLCFTIFLKEPGEKR